MQDAESDECWSPIVWPNSWQAIARFSLTESYS